MPVYFDAAQQELDSPIGITGTNRGGSGADMSTTSGYWKQATAGAAVVPVSEFALGDLPDGAANSVLGRAAASSGVLASIAAASSGDTLRMRNGALVWAREVFNAKDYGSVGDGSTDDAARITAMVTDALASGHDSPVIYFPPCVGYACATPITITLAAAGKLSVVMDAPLIYTGAAQTGAFFTIGITGANKTVQGTYFRLWVERATQSDWSDDSHSGLRLLNFNNCLIDIVALDYFTTGATLEGAGDGFAYNTIDIGRVLNTRYGFDLTHTQVGGVNGWCNGNRLRGGRFVYNTTGGASDTTNRYPARFRSQSGRTGSPNSIIWDHPIVEIGKSGDSYATGRGFLFERGNYIRIHDAHLEGMNEHAIFQGNATTTTDDPRDNYISLAYEASINNTKTDSTSVGTNVIVRAGQRVADAINKIIYAAPDVLSLLTPYDGTTVYVHGIGTLSTGATLAATAAKSAVDFGTDYISISSASSLGVKVQAGSVKQFRVAVDAASGGSTRLFVQAYDSTGAIITSSGAWVATTAYSVGNRVTPTSANINGLYYRATASTGSSGAAEPTWPTTAGGTVVDGDVTWTCEGPAPVRAAHGTSTVYNSALGGIWRTLPGFNETVFELSTYVAAAFIGVTAGSSNARVRAFRIYAADPPSNGTLPAVTLGYSGTQNWTRRAAVQSPQVSNFGTHSVGDTVWNIGVTTTAVGWRCLTAGTPGTWEPFGTKVVRVGTQFDKTSDTTLANITGLTATVAAGRTYEFEANLYTVSNASGGVKFAIGGTATATSITYEGMTVSGGTITQTRGAALGAAVGAVTAVTAAYARIVGTIVVNAAGTLTCQMAQNASFGTASSVLVGSTFRVTEVA